MVHKYIIPTRVNTLHIPFCVSTPTQKFTTNPLITQQTLFSQAQQTQSVHLPCTASQATPDTHTAHLTTQPPHTTCPGIIRSSQTGHRPGCGSRTQGFCVVCVTLGELSWHLILSPDQLTLISSHQVRIKKVPRVVLHFSVLYDEVKSLIFYITNLISLQ